MNGDRIIMLLSIIARGKGAQYIRMLKEKGLYLNYQCVGSGTASSEMMDILGLGNSDKDIMLSFGTYNAIDALSGELGKQVGSNMGYGGIAMVISPSAFSRITAEIIKRNSKDIVKGDGSNMHSEFDYSLILISVNRGYTDAVMQTAKRAGATGGTVIKARLAEAQEIEAYANTVLNDEKEIVTILAPNSIRNQILEDVNTEFGLKSEAQGTVLAVPVDKVFKI
ncbi:MAG: hypothetical protein E7596_06240 [Ruminococcaceae bacterium]|nr:hypothetical protein [Oscillospiraceae bacterium]